MTGKYLLAGQFAAAARLSPKALRLYAEKGLLLPAEVDPTTGYRFYAPEQLPRARLIGRLRKLGLPLARVGFLADLSPQARAIELRAWLDMQRSMLDESAAVIAAMEGAQDDNALTAAVALRDAPATKVLCRSRTIDTAWLAELVSIAERDIRAHLRASGLAGEGPVLVTFHDLVTPDSEGLVEVAVAYDGSVEPVDDLHIRLVSGHTEAYLPVPAGFEAYPMVLRLYDAIEAWTDASPHAVCIGSPYEIYPGTGGAPFDVAYPVAV